MEAAKRAEAIDEAAEPAVPSLVADSNEPRDLVDRIAALGIEVDRRRLAPADFVVGALAIERKNVQDFIGSLIRKRLFEQVTRLKAAYEGRVALLLEGDTAAFEELAEPRAAWGALSAIAIDLDVAILPTPSKEASANLLATLARRAARGPTARGDVRFKPRQLAPADAQKFAVQGLPGIGEGVSERLLDHFGSVRRVYAASEKELLRAPGIGKLRARQITAFLDRPFEGRQRRLVGGMAEPDS